MTCEEKGTATDSTVQGAELLRAGGIGCRSFPAVTPFLSNIGVHESPMALQSAPAACSAQPAIRGAEFDIESPAVEAGEGMPEGIRGKGEDAKCLIPAFLPVSSGCSALVEDFKPIRALLPVWTDPLTGEVLDLDELRRALMNE
jgi:hypothetical protein